MASIIAARYLHMIAATLPSTPFSGSRIMIARTFGFVVVAVALCGVSNDAVSQQKDKKKFEVPKDAIAGVVKSVDMKAHTFTLTLESKKERTFKVDDKTEFWGPKGGDRGTGPKGLTDDCMAKGYDIKVVPTKDPAVAKNVYLPNRK
jgi:hypothetical protein